MTDTTAFEAALAAAREGWNVAEQRAVKYIGQAKDQYEEGSPNYNALIRLAEFDRQQRDQYLAAAKALAAIIAGA